VKRARVRIPFNERKISGEMENFDKEEKGIMKSSSEKNKNEDFF